MNEQIVCPECGATGEDIDPIMCVFNMRRCLKCHVMFTPAFVNGVASVKIHIVKATDAQKKAYQEEMRNDNQR